MKMLTAAVAHQSGISFAQTDDAWSLKRGHCMCVQSRPFGVALLIAGYDEATGPVLYHADPSGTYVSYEARAIGSGSEGAQSLLQEKYTADLTLAEAEILVLQVLKQVRALPCEKAGCSSAPFWDCCCKLVTCRPAGWVGVQALGKALNTSCAQEGCIGRPPATLSATFGRLVQPASAINYQ